MIESCTKVQKIENFIPYKKCLVTIAVFSTVQKLWRLKASTVNLYKSPLLEMIKPALHIEGIKARWSSGMILA